jgi:hypothetical protein
MKKFLATLIMLVAPILGMAQTRTAPALEIPNEFQAIQLFDQGLLAGPINFAALPSFPQDGTQIYCSNCQEVDPCVAGGSGAFAKRINGAWACSRGSGGGGGGVGDALLNPPTDELFRATAPGVKFKFQCPVGASSGDYVVQFIDTDSSNIMGIQCGTHSVVFSDGVSGFWKAAFFARSSGSVASGLSSPLLRDTNTGCAVGFLNAAGTGNNLICSDNLDELIMSGFTHMKLGSLYFPQVTSMLSGGAMIASGTDTGFSSTGVVYADAPAYASGAGGDFCKILNNAATAANTLKVDVDARGVGPGTDMFCDSLPVPDAYAGNVYLPAANIHIRSVAGMFLMHSRVHIYGDREGRTASGPTSGTVITACANDNAVCNGATFNPTAGAVCKDGGGVTTVNCPLVTWSLSANPGVPVTQMFATTLENLTINCNGISGCIGVRAGMFPISGSCTGKCGPQENSWIKGVRIEDFGNAGIGIQALPGTSNFQMADLNLLNENLAIADCSAAVAIDIIFDSTVAANGPKRVANVTNTNSHCTTKPLQTMKLDAGQVRVEGIRAEDVSNYNVDLGARSNFYGTTIINANGVVSGANNAIIHVNAGHSGGLTAISTYNNNVAGYTVLDDLHSIFVRVDCQSTTAIYTFGSGLSAPVISDAPCIPKVVAASAPFITNVVLVAGDIVKFVPASATYQITKNNNTTETKRPLGVALAAIPDTVVRVPVALEGSIVGLGGIPGPILDTAMPNCAAGDFVYYGPTTDGKAQCSTARPSNTGVLGIALNVVTAGNQIPMLIRPDAPLQPQITECTGTGTSASPSVISCGTNNAGLIKCAHAATGGLCEVTFTHIGSPLKTTTLIHLQGDTTITTGCDPLTLPLYPSLRSFANPTSTCSAGNTFDCFQFPVQTLGGTNGLCVQFDMENITP